MGSQIDALASQLTEAIREIHRLRDLTVDLISALKAVERTHHTGQFGERYSFDAAGPTARRLEAALRKADSL